MSENRVGVNLNNGPAVVGGSVSKVACASPARPPRMPVFHGAEAAAERRLVRHLNKLNPRELMVLVHTVERRHRKVVEQERAELRRAQALGALP